MKPHHVADLIGFVTYFYAVNRRLPERQLLRVALREEGLAERSRAHTHTAVRRAFDTGRGTAFEADTQLERQEELTTPSR